MIRPGISVLHAHVRGLVPTGGVDAPLGLGGKLG